MLRGFFAAEVWLSIVIAFAVLYVAVKYKAKIFSSQGRAALRANILVMKIAIAIGMMSLLVFLAAKSTELISDSTPTYDLTLVTGIGEALHMFLFLITLSLFLLAFVRITRA